MILGPKIQRQPLKAIRQAPLRAGVAIDRGDERVDLASARARLGHLLRALFDLSPVLIGIPQGLATRRPFLSNLGLHLPESSRALRGSAAGRWYDAATAHAAAHLHHSVHRFERGGLKPIQIALVGLLEDARVELLASESLPGLRRLWLGFHDAVPAHGDGFVLLMLRLARGLLDPALDDPHPWVCKGRRLFFEATDGGRAPAHLTPAALREMASLLGNDIGQMRLQFNHQDYVVEPAYRDDNGYLWQRDEDNPPQLQSLADQPQPPPRRRQEPDAARVDPAEAAEPDGKENLADDADAGRRPEPIADRERTTEHQPLARLQYPEWDRLVGDYRSDWCTLLESRPDAADPRRLQMSVERHSALLQRLERVLRAGRLRSLVRLRAQLRGDELDIDAAVRSAIDRRSRRTPGQKVHQRLDRRERDVAALVLLDSSASTAAGLADSGSGDTGIDHGARSSTGDTLLDLAREAALLASLTLARAGDDCAIHAFASNGRHEVHYQSALDFEEPLDIPSIGRLAGLQSQLSTRMGAALRHASSRLAARPSRRRLLLFITDGEPHDIDIHDRRYLIEDARRAVLEAARLGLAVFCVTLDPAADDYVRTIFGAGNYRVLDRIDSLPRILPAMVLRLTR